jgi:glycosyltransferase involved in cell wall biosynthesis
MRAHLVALAARLLFGAQFRLVLNVHEHLTQSAHFLYPRVLDRLLMRAIVRYLFPLADLVVAVGKGVRDDLVESYDLAPTRTVVLHNPLNVAEIRRRAREDVALPPACIGHPLVVAAGHLVPLKGFDWLIEAFAELAPSVGARLLILGNGPERAALERQVQARGLDDVVFLVGLEANPWKFFARADAFILSSLTEAFPSVLGEAFALGVPVVASDCSPGVREYAEDGATAILVAPRDTAALAAAITRVLQDPALRRRLAARGRSRADAFLPQLMVERYEHTLWHVWNPRGAVPTSREDRSVRP